MAVRVAFEHHFHDSEAVSEYVGQAKAILEAWELLPEAMDATLAQCVALLAAKHTQLEQVGPLGIRPGILG